MRGAKLERSQGSAIDERSEEDQHRHGQWQRRRDSKQRAVHTAQVGGAGRGVHVRETYQHQRARCCPEQQQSQGGVRPAGRKHHDSRRAGQLEARPDAEEVPTRSDHHHAEGGKHRHGKADRYRVLCAPIGDRDPHRGGEQHRRLDEQAESVHEQRAAEVAADVGAHTQLNGEGGEQDQHR